jgi:hypothetical protein
MADPFAALNKACVKTFGSRCPVTYQQGAAAPFVLRAVPMKDSDEEQHHDGLYARLFANLVDFPSPPEHGDQATINGVAYTVFEVLIDAVDGVHLRLRAGG